MRYLYMFQVCEKLVETQQVKVQQKRADEAMMHWEQIAEYETKLNRNMKQSEKRGKLRH